MEVVQAVILFVLGVGAALLVYFTWQHVVPNSASGTLQATVIPINKTSTVGNGAPVM